MQNLTPSYSIQYNTLNSRIVQFKESNGYKIEIQKTIIESVVRQSDVYVAFVWYASTYKNWKVSDKNYYNRVWFVGKSKKQCIDELVRICFKPDFWCENRRKVYHFSTTVHHYETDVVNSISNVTKITTYHKQ